MLRRERRQWSWMPSKMCLLLEPLLRKLCILKFFIDPNGTLSSDQDLSSPVHFQVYPIYAFSYQRRNSTLGCSLSTNAAFRLGPHYKKRIVGNDPEVGLTQTPEPPLCDFSSSLEVLGSSDHQCEPGEVASWVLSILCSQRCRLAEFDSEYNTVSAE